VPSEEFAFIEAGSIGRTTDTRQNWKGSLATFASPTISPVSSAMQTLVFLHRDVQPSKMFHAALLLLMLEARNKGDLVSPSA
jgi:hypothetical protein